jgi:hypothetical protein
LCEFHYDASKQTLRCEGYDRLSSGTFSWRYVSDKKRWQKRYCEKMGKGCPYRKSLLLSKYGAIHEPERAAELLRKLKLKAHDEETETLLDAVIEIIE